MPIQVLPPLPQDSNQQFKQQLGSVLGTGLGQGISALLQNKLGQMNQQKQAQAWQSIGLAPEYANFLVSQPEWVQKEFVSRLEGIGSLPSQAGAGMGMSGMHPQAQGQIAPSQVQPSQPLGGLRFGASAEDKKRMHEEQKLINKEVFPYIKEVQQKAKGARENELRLKRMEKLIASGKLDSPAFASALKALKTGVNIGTSYGHVGHIGLDLSSLMSPESQEFEKLSADFIKNAKDIFGNRVTDQDLKSFLATVPTLSQTNEGKMAVIHNLRIMNKGAELREQAARALLKEYHNRPPLDFEAQVDDLVRPQLDALASQFESGYQGKTAKTMPLFGNVLGAVPDLILGNK